MSKVRACEVCRRWIQPGRLEAERHTLLCVECAVKIQKYGGEFILRTVQERTSKAGSLKRSYGSASIHKSRNYEAMEKLKAEHLAEQAKA